MWGLDAIAWYLHLSYFGHTPTIARDEGPVHTSILTRTTFIQQHLTTALHRKNKAYTHADAAQIANDIIDFWLTTGLIDQQPLGPSHFLTFRHLTFQEYGVANILKHAWQEDADRTWHFLKPRLHHFAWREPLLLLAEQMDTPAIDRLLHHLLQHPSPYDRTLQRDLFLAVTLAGESGRVSTPQIQRLSRRLNWFTKPHKLDQIVELLLIGLPIAVGALTAWWLQASTWLVIMSAITMFTVAILIFLSRPMARALFFLPMRQWTLRYRHVKKVLAARAQLGDASALHNRIADLVPRQYAEVDTDVVAALAQRGTARWSP